MNQTRKFWLDAMLKIAHPLLDALSRDCLRQEMPIESQMPRADREQYTYLEGFGRTLVGLAPWLACTTLPPEEEALRSDYAQLARTCISHAVDPEARDFMNFSQGYQPIVDAAFLAQGILRAPGQLWDPLDNRTKKNLIAALRATRTRKPWQSNWLLFSAMIEALLHHAGAADWDPMRIDFALRKHADWYHGDGLYGDGDHFQVDYYNSFVIQPMLLDVLAEVGGEYPEWKAMEGPAWERASQYARHLEHLISPEGTYPLVGRSLCYRFGAFHVLSMAALHHRLPVSPAQVRCGLTAVMDRMLAMPGMFDENGWLQVGVCGHQPAMGEPYISTGSLYLCTEVFLPLGLDETDPFWADPDADWTMKALWNGANLPCEHGI